MVEVVELLSGLRVANFSSPHPFTFEDGSVLPRVKPELVKHLSLNVVEHIHDMQYENEILKPFTTIQVEHEMTLSISQRIDECMMEHKLRHVDVVITPLPVMYALRTIWSLQKIYHSPFRTGRLKDRDREGSGEKVLFMDKFCI